MSLRIAHLSDIHFGAEDETALEAARTHILASSPDVLIVSGDVTQRGKRSEFEAARDWLDSFGLPTLTVPGNHDTPLLNLGARLSAPFARHERYFGAQDPRLHRGGVAFFGLNTARGAQLKANWAEGAVDLDVLDRLIADAKDLSIGEHCVLVCHHPFLSPPESPLQFSTRRGNRAAVRLAASRIGLLLAGHVHTPNAVLHESPEGRYLSVTAGTLSTRLRNVAPSFNLVQLEEGECEVTACRLTAEGIEEDRLGRWALN